MIKTLPPITPLAPLPPATKAPAADSSQSFSTQLSDALAQVNELQLKADELAKQLALGEIQDVHQVTVAMAQAQLSLQLAVQVRNKMVEAYQEIARMQV
ncbi:MAG: Flagellar hook-basal body complex protein FliE [Firmicutes bacterium]|nr:Flagellar hook-basal body complex protein FliE [candidate division NPL-UPA2 bacterium]